MAGSCRRLLQRCYRYRRRRMSLAEKMDKISRPSRGTFSFVLFHPHPKHNTHQSETERERDLHTYTPLTGCRQLDGGGQTNGGWMVFKLDLDAMSQRSAEKERDPERQRDKDKVV